MTEAFELEITANSSENNVLSDFGQIFAREMEAKSRF